MRPKGGPWGIPRAGWRASDVNVGEHHPHERIFEKYTVGISTINPSDWSYVSPNLANELGHHLARIKFRNVLGHSRTLAENGRCVLQCFVGRKPMPQGLCKSSPRLLQDAYPHVFQEARRFHTASCCIELLFGN